MSLRTVPLFNRLCLKTFQALLFLSLVSCGIETPSDELKVYLASNSPEVECALHKLESTLDSIGIKINKVHSSKTQAHLTINAPKFSHNQQGNDGFTIHKDRHSYTISSECPRGLMYGILNIVEQLHTLGDFDAIKEQKVVAHYPFRAIKFNLPWYSYRQGKHLSIHSETCKDLKFWESFLDMMQENKFNTLTLWGLHPYMYMVKSKSFPEVSPFTDAELAVWKQFWKALFRMAKERGIDTYIVNWNIFVPEEFSKRYGVADYGTSFWGEGETNDHIEKYTREVVRQTIDEYTDLTGIGITLGERMGGMTSDERKDWINRTMIAGLKNAKREARLLYRAPLSAGLSSEGTTSVSTEQITRNAIENLALENETWIEFKYNWSHGHSSPKVSIVHGGILTDTYWKPLSNKYRGVWTVRNEDFFVLRWAQTDFIRNFIKNNSQPYIGGSIIGSECYIPAFDYITKDAYKMWDYAFERQWLFYKVWGNLLYNPATKDAYFAHQIENRFSTENGAQVLKAWNLVSKNATRLASFYRGTWDATLYSEGFRGSRKQGNAGFIDINSFISQAVLDSSYMNIYDFVHTPHTSRGKITPLELASQLEQDNQRAFDIVTNIEQTHHSKALSIELSDIKAWTWHGKYFANKLRAGVALETFRLNGDNEQHQNAIIYLKECYACWQNLTKQIELYNNQIIPYQFDQQFSWRKHLIDAEKDIEIARLNYIQE